MKINENFLNVDDNLIFYTSNENSFLNIIHTKFKNIPVRVYYDFNKQMYVFGNAFDLAHINLLNYMADYTNKYDDLDKELPQWKNKESLFFNYLNSKTAMFQIIWNNNLNDYVDYDGYDEGYWTIYDDFFVICRNDEVQKIKNISLFNDIPFNSQEEENIMNYDETLDETLYNSEINNILKNAGVKLNESIYFNDEVFNDWNDSYEQLTVILNPSIEWLRNQLNKPDAWGFRFLHNVEKDKLYVWDTHQSWMHQQVFDIVDMDWGKPGMNVVGIFEPDGVAIWEELADDGTKESSIALAKKLDGKLFGELYPNGYKIYTCS